LGVICVADSDAFNAIGSVTLRFKRDAEIMSLDVGYSLTLLAS